MEWNQEQNIGEEEMDRNGGKNVERNEGEKQRENEREIVENLREK